MLYEMKKHTGELPIIGVNTFENPTIVPNQTKMKLSRATEEEKQSQVEHVLAFQAEHQEQAANALAKLKEVANQNGNIFAELMETGKVATLGQITKALYEVGGQYRRNM
jgi:isobutyryl-CoA mutase